MPKYLKDVRSLSKKRTIQIKLKHESNLLWQFNLHSDGARINKTVEIYIENRKFVLKKVDRSK